MLLVSSFLMLLLVACAADEENGAAETPTPLATRIPPDALPTVEGRLVTSPAKGYVVTFPEGWEPRFNIATTPNQRLDAYFAPAGAPDEFRAVITVSCKTIAPGTDTASFFADEAAIVSSLIGGEVPEAAPIELSEENALRTAYTQKVQQGGAEVRKFDVYLARGTCGYTISLTTAPVRATELLPAFEEFLRSVRFL